MRDLREAICLDEFRGYEAANPDITFKIRVTSQDGRLGRAEIEGLLKEMPEASFFVCGPTAFETSVKHLADAGVLPEQIKVETFTQAGGAVVAPAKALSVKERPKLPPLTAVEFPFKPIKAGEYVDMLDEAKAFLTQVFYENSVLGALPSRLRDVEREIARTGTYTHTYDELSYGCA